MKYLLNIMIVLFLGACSTLKVQTDYNPEYDFSRLETFAVVHKERAGDDTLNSDRILRAITRTLAEKGYNEHAQQDADFYVLFHTDVRSKTQIDTDYEYVGLFPYGYYGYFPMAMVPTTRVSTYEEAQLIVDIVRPEGNRIIWRGMATDRVKSYKTPQERTRYIDEVISAILKSFPAHSAVTKETP
jgi:hypothetical protein